MSETPSAAAVVIAALAALAGCGPGSRAPRSCSAKSDCPAEALCVAGACVVSTPPAATVSAAELSGFTNRPLRFDASASADADAEDGISQYRWTVAPLGPPACEPDFRSSTTAALLEVAFPCEGDYEVTLVVVDSTSIESRPVSRRVHIAPDPSPEPPAPPPAPEAPAVAAGPAIDVAHRCSGSPLRCGLADPDGQPAAVSLGATASSKDGGPVALSWACEPPAGASAAVVELSDRQSAAPLFTARTDGAAIAGAYRCTVTAESPNGLTATAVQTVRVGNRPPVLAAAAMPPVPHRFDSAAGGTYVASGITPGVIASDPDGDPLLAPTFRAEVSAPDAGTLQLTGNGRSAGFSLTAPRDAPHTFIGPARAIVATVADVNGATAEPVAWPLVIANRPPVVSFTPVPPVAHFFDWSTRRYTASALLATVTDPDGDPLLGAAAAGALCTRATLLAGGGVEVSCALQFAGVASLGSFAVAHSFDVVVSDAWSSGRAAASLTIDNTPPLVTPFTAYVGRVSDAACCRWDSYEPGVPPICAASYVQQLGGSKAVVPALPTDANQDPVELRVKSATRATASPDRSSCASGSCEPLTFTLPPGPRFCAGVDPAPDTTGTITVVAWDGVAESAPVLVQVY